MKAFVDLSVSQTGWLNSVDKWCCWKRAQSSLEISRCVVRVLNAGQSLDSTGPFISLGIQQITTLNLNCHNAIYSKWDRNNT